MAITIERAQELAQDILLALAEQPEELVRFMETAGLQVSDLRELSNRPEIAVFLLDFLVEDDERLLAFAQALNLRPQDVMAARTALSGPGSFGWTVD
ncbi:DUF3572 domain-containing protein [Paracoccus sp. (in: a-proteobacteria)]|uniref:DUF3572 domain-containing protein n=1 Tax=Paracoccus sp. TaxID=267 RepID=UPI00396C5F06